MNKLKIVFFFTLSLSLALSPGFGFLKAAGNNLDTSSKNNAMLEVAGSFSADDLFLVRAPVKYKDGILFTYFSKEKENVFLGGTFNHWEKIPMLRNRLGISYFLLRDNLFSEQYRYRFSIDGIWRNDPSNSDLTLDEQGNEVSYFSIQAPLFLVIKNPHLKEDTNENEIFYFYLPDKNYKTVHWVSNLERWSKSRDRMTKQGNYWVLEKKIYAREVEYVFMADGEFLLDPSNLQTRNNAYGQSVNYFYR